MVVPFKDRIAACLALALLAGCSRTGLDDRVWPGPSTPVLTDAGASQDGGRGTGDASLPDAGTGARGDAGVDAPTAEGGPGSAPPPDPSAASSYLINTAHTGSIEDPTLTPPLVRAWTLDLGKPLSYPLIAGGLVYVIVNGIWMTPSSKLVALDAKTGAVAWGPVDAGGAQALALDGGRLFTLDGKANLQAFDAATGKSIWKVPLIKPPYQAEASAPPTAYRGIVYTSLINTVLAADERDGTILWSHTIFGGDISAPTVSDQAAFASFFCRQNYAYDRITGATLWHPEGPCMAGQGATPALFGGTLFTRDDGVPSGTEIAAADGSTLGTFSATVPPAFHGTRGYFTSGFFYAPDGPTGTLTAADATTGKVAWTFSGDGALTTAPLVVGGAVYVGSWNGALFGLDEATGAQIFSDQVGAHLQSETSTSIQPVDVAMAAAGGILVVPAGSTLIGYVHDADAGP